MRWRTWVAVVAAVSWVSPAGGTGGSSRTVYVDCAAAPGGDGSQEHPVPSITAALPIAEALAGLYATTIDVTGICSAETFPIDLRVPLHLRGKRLPRYDGRGFPLPDQWRDTVIVRPASSPAPSTMLLITSDGVRVSQISLDGQVAFPPDGAAGPAVNNPSGILVQGVDGFAITGVRVANVASGVVTFVSGGSISGSYLGPAGTSVGLFGGDSETTVVVLNNTIEYRANGVAVAGGIQANPTTGTPAGTAITAHIWRNTIVTSYTDVGPTNPAAVRLAPMIQEATDGDTRATVLYNRVLGPTKYSFLIFAGPQVALGGGPYTGTVEAAIFGTELDEAAAEALAVVTFTNARATIWPDPRYRPADYMQDGLFDLRHGGELDTALVDHPQFFGGVELGNVYLENGEVVDYGTFVVVP